MELENLNLLKLNAQEIQEVEGGGIFRVVSYLLDAAAVYDAIEDFKSGWNSVSDSQVSSGSW
ncbi:hypothetical protein BC749_10488 [Flavobacterium araucananum]|uniref:Bacteriocin n=1 Tax=Flavobacterium araucananum TaxID=946678 RepID=A0A227NX80_9FLAO|nr:hypothetical protein [Flavobacterium araucananum]OXG01556.1 hypothetical protein B0A64_19010 [Flavobacterium araucananum]PWJ98942.1 hypothetical protein BC749_10488 [Flavobacterium araucananum]